MTVDQDIHAPPGASSEGAAEGPASHLCLILPEETGEAGAVPMAQRLVWVCAEGQRLAEERPEGVDVAEGGRPLGAPMDKVTLGPNVEWNADHTAVVAKRAGQYSIRRGMLDVDDELDLLHDLDATAGAIDFPGTVLLRKSVLDLVKLTASGDVVVHGSVEAAQVTTRGALTVHHGICGKETGRVTAGGSVTARFASNANVTAGGDILMAKEVNNSKMFCRGKFFGEHASILSGHVVAMNGIVCETAGTESGGKVILELALPAEEMQKVGTVGPQLKNLRTNAQNIRNVVEPLLKNAKGLTHQQKEKATELLYSAQDTEQKITQIIAALEGPRKALEGLMKVPIVVKSTLCPGVVIRIGGAEAVVRKVVKGPVKIVRDDDGHTPRIVMLDGHNQALPPLVTTQLPEMGVLQQLLRGQL